MTNERKRTNAVVTVTYTDDGKMLFDVAGYKVITFDPSKASAECRTEAMFHGFEQRLRDAAAIQRDDETGLPATPADKGARIERLRDHYESGATEWALVGGGGGNRSLTIEAIARVKGWDYERAEAMVGEFAKKQFSDDTKKALAYFRKGKAVMEAMDAIRKERMPAPALDADKALEELGNAQ